MTSRRLLDVAIVLGIVALGLAILSFGPWGDLKGWFSLVFFGFPLLWSLWIFSVLSRQVTEALSRVVMLWAIIDLAVLTLFISFSLSMDGWARSSGIEMVTGIVYMPLGTGMLSLISLLPDGTREALVGNLKALEGAFSKGSANAFGLWLSMSLLSILPSVVLGGGAWWFHHDKHDKGSND
jgi:hypothetical protein